MTIETGLLLYVLGVVAPIAVIGVTAMVALWAMLRKVIGDDER